MIDKIYNEDCLVGMSRIPTRSVDAVVCDLPYGTTACAWDSVIPFDLLWAEYNRILKDNGTMVMFGSEPFSTKMRMSNIEQYKYDWVWSKNNCTGFQHAKNMPLKDYELISIFSKGGMGHASLLKERRMTYNPQGVIRVNKRSFSSRNQWTIIGKRPSHKDSYITEFENYPRMILSFKSETNGFHPTQKPVDLIEYLVRTYSNEGEIILDNCMGSGTTAIACIRSNRHFIGFEKDTEFYKKAVERIKAEQMQLSLW